MLAERRRGKDVLEGGPSAGERVARGGPEAPDKRTRRPPERSRCSHSARRGGRETQRAATPQPPSAAQMILIDPNRPRQQRPREHQEGRLFPGPPARRSPCPATGPRPTFPQGEGQQLVEPGVAQLPGPPTGPLQGSRHKCHSLRGVGIHQTEQLGQTFCKRQAHKPDPEEPVAASDLCCASHRS